MRTLLTLIAILLSANWCIAQKNQQYFEGELLGKSMFLRGLWESNELSFSGDGTISGKSGLTSPLLSSVEITEVQLQPDRLVLIGRRMASIHVSQPELLDLKQPIRIVISQSAEGNYDAALSTILTTKMSDLAPYAPEMWKEFLDQNALAQPGRTPSTRDPRLLRLRGPGVTPPIVISSPEPEWTKLARKFNLNGNVLIYLHVDEHGKPTHIRIVKPIGLGLDENAAAAVANYRFQPATEDGVPREMEMNVEVVFSR